MISYDACNKYEQITHAYLRGRGREVPECPPTVYDEYLKNSLTNLHQPL